MLNDVEGQEQEKIEDLIKARNDLIESSAQKQANKILKKQRFEIKRLNDLIEESIIKNSFDSYEYGIKKLRDIYRQPYNDELIRMNWETTRQTIMDLINEKSPEATQENM